MSESLKDLEWFASNPPELTPYKDKYVAIFHQQIIGWGDTVKEASDMAKGKIKDADPLIAFIEENELLALWCRRTDLPYVRYD